MPAFRDIGELPRTARLFLLGGAVLFPRGSLALNVFEPRYLNMVDDAMAGDRLIGIIQPTEKEELGAPAAMAPVGAIGQISTFAETDDGRYLISLLGVCRFRVEQETPRASPYRQAIVCYDEFAADLDRELEDVDRERLVGAFADYASGLGYDIGADALARASVEDVMSAAANMCPFAPETKQALLEESSLSARCAALTGLLEAGAPDRGEPD